MANKGQERLSNDQPQLVDYGGDLGAAIHPGDSARSPLVHYIAGLVEDMEMPPEGKAPVLSRDEIALVRGWIDQGGGLVDTGDHCHRGALHALDNA